MLIVQLFKSPEYPEALYVVKAVRERLLDYILLGGDADRDGNGNIIKFSKVNIIPCKCRVCSFSTVRIYRNDN